MTLFRPFLAVTVTALLLGLFLVHPNVKASASTPDITCPGCLPKPSIPPTHLPTPVPTPTPVVCTPNTNVLLKSMNVTYDGSFDDTSANMSVGELAPNYPTDQCAEMSLSQYRFDASDPSGNTWESIILCQGSSQLCVTTASSAALYCYEANGSVTCGVIEVNPSESMPQAGLAASSSCGSILYTYNGKQVASSAASGCGAYAMVIQLASWASSSYGTNYFGGINGTATAQNLATSSNGSTWTYWTGGTSSCTSEFSNEFVQEVYAPPSVSWGLTTSYSCRSSGWGPM